jgi:hypothetical protein
MGLRCLGLLLSHAKGLLLSHAKGLLLSHAKGLLLSHAKRLLCLCRRAGDGYGDTRACRR